MLNLRRKWRPLALAAALGWCSAANAQVVQSGSTGELPITPPVDYYKGYSMGGHNDYLFRWEENYGYLVNPALSNDLFDPLKYLPLTRDGHSWLTLNAGLRLMYDHNLTNILKTPFGATNDAYSRATVGADIHIGDHFRAYVDVIDGQYHGTSPVPGVTTTDMGIYNAFVEFMGKAGQTEYGIRAGRQQVWIGNSLLFGTNELTNVPTTQNGVRGYADWGKGRIDLFDFMPTDYGQSALSGNINTGVHMAGFYGSFDLPDFSLFGLPAKTTLDPFLFPFHRGKRHVLRFEPRAAFRRAAGIRDRFGRTQHRRPALFGHHRADRLRLHGRAAERQFCRASGRCVDVRDLYRVHLQGHAVQAAHWLAGRRRIGRG